MSSGASRLVRAVLLATASMTFTVTMSAEQTFYSYSLVDGQGKDLPLSTYKGKVVVIVNLASKSSFASQIAALEKLQQADKDKGLVIIGVPSGDFGNEEPATDAEIQKHYVTDEHVTFPVTAKSSVRGKDELPVYSFLTRGPKEGDKGEDVHWNFTKFVISRDGKVLARFEPDVTPDDPDFRITIEKALAGTLKEKSAKAAADSPRQKPAENDRRE
jgi:glutathione peroxidase